MSKGESEQVAIKEAKAGGGVNAVVLYSISRPLSTEPAKQALNDTIVL